MEKDKKYTFTTRDPFYLDKLKAIIKSPDDKKLGVPSLEEFLTGKIGDYTKLAKVSNDPSFYLGKVDALQEVQTKLKTIIEIANSQYSAFQFNDPLQEFTKLKFNDFNTNENVDGNI